MPHTEGGRRRRKEADGRGRPFDPAVGGRTEGGRPFAPAYGWLSSAYHLALHPDAAQLAGIGELKGLPLSSAICII